MSKVVFKALCGIGLAALVAFSVSSCSMDPPKNGVQIKVANKLTDAQVKDLKEALKKLDSGINSTGHMTVNGATTINLSPVADVKAFSAKIDFGTVKSTAGNVITLEVDTAKLGGAPADPAADPAKTPDPAKTE